MCEDATRSVRIGRLEVARRDGLIVICVSCINLLASAALALALRPGTLVEPDPIARVAYIAEHGLLFSAGWSLWIAATISLLVFFLIMYKHLDAQRKDWLRLAVALAIVGSVPDVVSNLISMSVLPRLAENYISAEGISRQIALELFIAWERFAVLLTGGLVNLFYGLAGVCLTYVTFKTRGFPRWIAWLGAPLWLSTFLLSLAGFMLSGVFLAVAAAATMTIFIVWSFCIGYFYLLCGRSQRLWLEDGKVEYERERDRKQRD